MGYDQIRYMMAMGNSKPFSPRDISGLAAWWKADDLSLSDGDPVDTWLDSTAADLYLTGPGSGSTSPTFKTSIINGWPVVRFNGSTDGMGMNLTNLAPDQPVTVFAVFKQVTGYPGGYNQPGPIYAHGFSGSRPFGLGCDSSGFAMLSHDLGVTVLSGSTNLQGAFHILTGIENGASSLLYVDGEQVDSGTLSNFGVGQLALGIQPAYGVGWTGDIAEFLIYQGALLNNDRIAIETYLSSKYGIPT